VQAIAGLVAGAILVMAMALGHGAGQAHDRAPPAREELTAARALPFLQAGEEGQAAESGVSAVTI
jgi:hypothetical protein